MKYFSYDSGSGFELHETEEEAKLTAEDSIDYYRQNSCEGWDEEVETVCWGKVKGHSTRGETRPVDANDLVNSEIEFVCDYQLENP